MCLELREDSDRFRSLFLRFLWSEEEEEEEVDSSDEESQEEEEEEVDLFLFFFNLEVLINHEALPTVSKIQHFGQSSADVCQAFELLHLQHNYVF